MVNNNSFSIRRGFISSIGYGHTYANNEQQADPNSTAPTNFLGSTTSEIIRTGKDCFLFVFCSDVVNNNSFTIENDGPNSSVDGAGAALVQKSTSTDQRLVTPPPSNYSNISEIILIKNQVLFSFNSSCLPRSIKTASFTGRFRTVNDEKTVILRP